MNNSNDLLTASPLLSQTDTQALSTDALRVASAQSSLKTDLLWRHSVEGTNASWSMDGTRYAKGSYLTPVKDPNWQIVGTGDYSRDGQDDILWRHSDGSLAWWVMDGTAIAKAIFLTTPAVKDLNWQIVGTGDYNRDGQVDILWRHSDGSVAWWVMDGTAIGSSVYLPALKDANLKIVGTGDINQDKQVDILWRNTATGENFWWVTNGSAVTEKRVLPPVTDLNWTIATTGDFNGDAKVDLVWRNSSTGANSIWLMNGVDVIDSVAVLAVGDTNWKIMGVLRHPAEALPAVSATLAPVASLLASGNLGALASAIAEISATFSSTAQVSVSRLSNFHRFTIAQSGVFNASLTGLTGDADVRLVQDVNQNGEVDPGEVLAWQWERGTIGESIRRFLTAGTYYTQVMSYASQTANYALTTSFTPAASDDQKFEFKLNFDAQGLSGLTEAAKAAIVDAAKFWESAITGRSAITRSNQLTVTLSGKSLLYSNGSADTGKMALSGPQFGLDGPNLIISSGISTLNARRFAEFNANPTYLRNIMIHEFAHVLGFGTLWEPVQFASSTGQVFNFGKNLINRSNATYNANTYAGWAYGELTGSFTQTAVPIEPGALAHWDETRFDTELLTPYAEVSGVATPLSQLTLAALRDLGWNLNFGVSQAYSLPPVAPVVTIAPTLPRNQLAAYTSCGCTRCLSASSAVYAIDGKTLTEAIGPSSTSAS